MGTSTFLPFCAAVTLAWAGVVQADEINNGPNRAGVLVGAISETSPFTDVSNSSQAIISGNFKYEGLYWQGSELGYRFIENSDVQVAAVLRPFEGFELQKDDLAQGFKGLEEREGKIEYGLSASFNTGPFVTTITPLWNSEGMAAELEASKSWVFDNVMLIAKAYTRYQDKDYQNYYFGVSQAEANNPLNTKVANAWQADSGFSFGSKLIGIYNINDDFYLQGLLGFTKLDSALSDSPIVDTTSLFQVGVGIGYRF